MMNPILGRDHTTEHWMTTYSHGISTSIMTGRSVPIGEMAGDKF